MNGEKGSGRMGNRMERTCKQNMTGSTLRKRDGVVMIIGLSTATYSGRPLYLTYTHID